jgi:hypothetical protein
MTPHTETKETNTSDDITNTICVYPETDDDTAATVEDEDPHVLPFVGKEAAACFDGTTSPKLLKVDRAYKWGPGTTIYDDKGSALFELIAQEGCADRSGAGPIYEAVITEIKTRKPVAYVTKGVEVFRETYHIYTAYPNYDSQPITRMREGAEDRDVYALGTLRQSIFGKNYVYKPCRQGFRFKTAMHLKFYNADEQKNPAIIKDQGKSTLTATPRETLLQAICIVYAVDRLTNLRTNEVVGMGVRLRLGSGFAYACAT